MIDNLPFLCLRNINKYLNFYDNINLKITCKQLLQMVQIDEIVCLNKNISLIFLQKMTNIKTLKLRNAKFNDINFLSKLQILHLYGNKCQIDQNGIKNLNLTELNVSNNPKITNVNFMFNLKKLIASGKCGINQEGINGLNLTELDATNNPKITKINFVKY
jgi:hypothetical protein